MVILVVMDDTKPNQNDRSKRRKRKSETDEYRYEVAHSEEMQQSDIDTLARCIASLIYQEMQAVAIEAMSTALPVYNPLTDAKGTSIRVTDEMRHRYQLSMSVSMDFQKFTENNSEYAERVKDAIRRKQELSKYVTENFQKLIDEQTGESHE